MYANTCLLSSRLRTAAPPKKTQCLLPILRPWMPGLCSKNCVQKSFQGNKTTERCSQLRHKFQHQHLTQVKGEGAVGVGSALSTSTDGCKEREERSTGVHFQHDCSAFRAFFLRQTAAVCSLSALCSALHSWSIPFHSGSTVFPRCDPHTFQEQHVEGAPVPNFQISSVVVHLGVFRHCGHILQFTGLSLVPGQSVCLPSPSRSSSGEGHVAWGLAADQVVCRRALLWQSNAPEATLEWDGDRVNSEPLVQDHLSCLRLHIIYLPLERVVLAAIQLRNMRLLP